MTDPNMKSGIISLAPLYKFAENNKNRLGLKGKGPESTEYASEIAKVLNGIKNEKDRGFYIWGMYENKNNLWRTIYLGKAEAGEKRKTASLSERLRKELSNERLIFWCDSKTPKNEDEEESIIKEMKKHYKNKKDYSNNWHNAYQKKGSSHIIWVATPDIPNKNILKIEADLIETMNPSANIKRPKPDSELQDDTIAIIKEMKHLIHKNRPKNKKASI